MGKTRVFDVFSQLFPNVFLAEGTRFYRNSRPVLTRAVVVAFLPFTGGSHWCLPVTGKEPQGNLTRKLTFTNKIATGSKPEKASKIE